MEHDPGPQGQDGGGGAGQTAPAARDEHADDPLLRVRARLDAVEELPLGERADVFERTHTVVTDELKKLELT